MKIIIFLLIIGAIILFVCGKIRKHFKTPHLNALNVVIGEVKSGKTISSVTLALKEIKKRQRRITIVNAIRKFFNKDPFEMPLLYSNIPLATDFVLITPELLQRKMRFRYGSVVFLDEVSFVNDKMLYKDQVICDSVKDFYKLFGHETGGYSGCGHGVLICDTQSISDTSKEFRACIGRAFYVEGISAPFYLPIFAISKLREERYSEDGTTVTSYNEDMELSMRKFLFRKKHFKFYDSCCYSELTDDLEVEDDIIHGAFLPDLKTNIIVSFKERYNKGVVNNEKKDIESSI